MSTTLTAPAPPQARIPKPATLLSILLFREPMLSGLRRRYGDVFGIDLPLFGPSVIVSNPALVKQVFQAKSDVLSVGEKSPLGKVLGPGSLFSMDGDEHLRERRLILPAFHGERMKSYESIIEEEALREMESWPEGEAFPTLEPFMRITLNSILRAVFGAHGRDIEELADVLPPFVTLGSRLSLLPPLQRDLGSWSPGGRLKRLRARYDAIIDRMIDAHLADPRLEERDDIMSLLLGAHYDDGSSMSRSAISDELLTLLAAGHETTATSLAWTVERLRRHPWILRRLMAEADEGGKELRLATILEIQRTRSVISGTSRHTIEDFPLGEWIVPKGTQIVVSAQMIHRDERFFERPLQFQPDRFIDTKPDTYTWIPFGGGTRRCPGAAFAHMEMDVVLRTLLRRFELTTTTERGERWNDRGIAFAPAGGGVGVVQRRKAATEQVSEKRPAMAAAAA